MLLADVITSWLLMADVLAIVGDVKATLFICVTHNCWFCGRCYCHIVRLMYLPNVSVMARKTFSHTPDEAMSVGLVKACDLRENLFC